MDSFVLMDLEPLVEGVVMLTKSEECRGMVDKRLNNEGM